MAEEINKAPHKNGVKSAEAKTPVKDTPLGDFDSIDAFTKNGFAEIVEATKSLNAFPSGATRDLYCAYPSFGKVIDLQSERILEIISKVLKWQNIRGNIQRRPPDEQFEMILECNDSMLERLGCNLDELAGIKKNPQAVVIESCSSGKDRGLADNGVSLSAGSWNNKSNEFLSNMKARLITAKNIARPQAKFQIPVDNRSSTPFVPKIKEKPNSLKPLAILPEYDENGCIASYLHPYEFELMKFKVTEAQLCRKQPKKPLEMSETELVYVDTESRLENALEELRGCTEIAVDVEHHSYRTFQGITCLVQISTRSKDYLFDSLELREKLHALNEIFTNAKIVKIFHGADLDIEWLQRDLSLYVVNMFDSHQAAKVLNLPRLSLAYLLRHYCDIEADKTFQLADWRIRPLPQELIDYARQDTHFLIYIYERLTNDILDAANNQTNLLLTVYQRSTDICKKRYFKPSITPEAHLDIFRKSKRIFDNRQLFALREIFHWRDTVARTEDESYGFVLPNHMMLQIAEILPREMQGILACCNPVPPLVRQNLNIIHQIILRARQQPLVKPMLETSVIHRVVESNTKDYNNKLYCPHDLSRCTEFRDDLPTLFNFKSATANGQEMHVQDECINSVNMVKPELSILETVDNSENEAIRSNLQRRNKMQCITPYERYLAILPQAEKEKLEEAVRIEEENKKRRLCPAAPTADEAIVVKTELPKQSNSSNSDDEDILYNLPIRELLKRKYEEVMARKNLSDSDESLKAKRVAMANKGVDDLDRTKVKKHKNGPRSSYDQNEADGKNRLFIKELLQQKFDEAMARKDLSNFNESLKPKQMAVMGKDEEQLVCTKIKKEKKSKIKSKKDKYKNSNKKQTIVEVLRHNSNVDISDYDGLLDQESSPPLVRGENKKLVHHKKAKHVELKRKQKKDKSDNSKTEQTTVEVAQRNSNDNISGDDGQPEEKPSISLVNGEDIFLLHHKKAKHVESKKKFKKKKIEVSKKEQNIFDVVRHNCNEDVSNDDSPPEEKPSTSLVYDEYQQLNQYHIKAKHAQKRNKKIRREEAKRKSKQSSNNPVEEISFDYKNVDYTKFQGGAQRAEGIQLKHRFHGKGNARKINNKKFNKLFTFSNVKGKK